MTLPSPRFFRRLTSRPDGAWSALDGGRSRDWESSYRERWQHDRIVRSTHGVNCTGSCSWQVHVKQGIVTWETQQTDYPENGADVPDYEPRGCPRGASFSWYVYSPLRIRHPYVRGALLERYRAALATTGDPVDAWAAIVDDPEARLAYTSQRGKGGLARASWDEVADMVAAAHVHTILRWGPDRIVGFSPIPAMSMVSYSAGTRFFSLMGGVLTSFYDWYADLPPASPQVWGDQTDVPESADWWNATYLMMWGSNIPMTRTPDAHFMTEARYKGQKTVVVSPDYSDHTKFADHWLAAQPGTDGALALAMTHVILREFYVERETPYFADYARRFTDLPFLVRLTERDGAHVAGAFLTAADLGETSENAEAKTVVWDTTAARPAVPNGSIGFRWGDEGLGRWNLDLQGVVPAITLLDTGESVAVDLPRFDVGDTEGGTVMRRGVPVRRVGGHLVTTVFDLLAAQLGVAREGLPGDWPDGLDDPEPYTPAWQEEITGVDAGLVTRIAREFARNAERTNGRSMIVMGAGTNHWYHSDLIYRAMLSMVVLCGCQGVNGGGWAHYVGQEKVRPITGFSQVAFALDWNRPPRHQAATPFWYLATEQYRYEAFAADELASPLGDGAMRGAHFADLYAKAARMGWLPAYPSFDRNPLEITPAAEAEGITPADYVVRELKAGALRFAAEDPGAPENFPRVLTLWRSNLFGSSSKGHEHFLKHLLGVTTSAIRGEESPPELRPAEVVWHNEAAEAKLDLLVTLDFRMNGSCLHSDVVLPAATWYEKHDISSTDLHPFVHAFSPAIGPPWETRTDWDIFVRLAESFSRLAERHLGVRTDLVAAPLLHDSPDELAQIGAPVRDWKLGECEPIPGQTMPRLIPVVRDYPALHARMTALGPLVESAGTAWKGVSWTPDREVEELAVRHGRVRGGPANGRPRMERAEQVCETILALSGTTNGRLAVESFRALEKRTGNGLADLATEHAETRITFEDTQIQPRKVIASAEWSGMESRERRYSPFTINIEREVPFRTLTGRQHFYLDHPWMREYGEGLPAYRPPLNLARHLGQQGIDDGVAEVTLRYLTPHSKWSIHSTYQDNLQMLTLFRGGPVIWLSPLDADRIGVRDNDWIEAYNRNGVVACRAVVSHRIPEGTSLMYHAQDRHINVPLSEVSGTRGGTHNSLTKITIKPTHMIGGYAQLSWGFNYYGPTGSQRDELTVIRRRQSEVAY
ncbi:nitrate reductase subunit alpha [Miltoncostaea oceani]|uniref:nitrate reductase subunit alpha n=1 Tax=Miltoncostaea oceani TaxID=2843216 RepID=UPI003CCE8F4D